MNRIIVSKRRFHYACLEVDMRFNVSAVVFLFICCLFPGCRFPSAHLPNKLPETEPLADNLTLDALDEWAESLAGINKVLDGEMIYVTLIDPVYVVTPGKKKEIDEIGFGMPRGEGMMYSAEYKFETPHDKCTWISAFIGFPLEFKLGITPGINYSGTSYKQSYEKVGGGRFKPAGEMRRPANMNPGEETDWLPEGYVIDDLEAWKNSAEPYLGMYAKSPEGDSTLYIEIAIELPEGDSWLNNMDTSFGDSDKFTLHLKAYRKDDSANIAYGAVEVRYKNIIPFLTELAATVASVQGFHVITDEQKEWLANEPVTKIDAWGKFLEAYAKRTWEYVDCVPADTKSNRYLKKIYDALSESDPGNSVSLSAGDTSTGWTREKHPLSVWEWALEHKPYLPSIYERAQTTRQHELVSKGGLYDASELWIQAVKVRPDIAKFHMYNAGVLLKNGKYDDAVDEYRASLRIEPGKNFNLWHTLRVWGGKLQGDTNLETETRFAEMVVEEHPDASSERDYLATLYQMSGDDSKAIDQYDQSKDLNVGLHLGKEYVKKGMTAKAIEIYEKLVVDHADYGHNWLELADLYEIAGNDEKELWALQGFLDNIKLENSGWPSYLPAVNSRIAGLTGDVAGQIRNILVEYPFQYSADERNLDLAEAIYSEGYLNDAFFLVYMFLSQLNFRSGRLSDKEERLYGRAETLREKFLKEFWPEFDPSNVTDEWEILSNHYKEIDEMKRADGINVAVVRYRELLDGWVGLTQVRNYCTMVEQVYKDDLEAIMEAKLIVVIVTEHTEDHYAHSSLSGFRNWGDRYERHLKEKLEGLYGIAG